MKSQRGSFALGLIVGLLIGLALALGVALYINKVPAPFVNKVPHRSADQDAAETQRNKDWDPNAALAGKNPARPAAAAATGVVSGGVVSGGVVSGGVVDGTQADSKPTAGVSATPGASAARSAAAADRGTRSARDPAAILSGQAAASTPGSTAAAGEALIYFVQAGAYSRAEDAEQQLAKLAMLGLDGRVTEREQSGRKVHRVRLGPFERRDEAEAAQRRLSEANVDANLVRVAR